MRYLISLAFPVGLSALCGLTGCNLSGSNPGKGNVVTSPRTEDQDPFRPALLRIHPLTHVDTAPVDKDGKAEGACRIVLHLELKDRYGDSVKALGKLKVEMSKPVGGSAGSLPGNESRELTWDVPEMATADENFRRFDAPTRTYRISLNAPKWLCDSFAKSAPGRKEGTGYFRLRAIYELPGGEGKYLRDEYVVPG